MEIEYVLIAILTVCLIHFYRKYRYFKKKFMEQDIKQARKNYLKANRKDIILRNKIANYDKITKYMTLTEIHKFNRDFTKYILGE